MENSNQLKSNLINIPLNYSQLGESQQIDFKQLLASFQEKSNLENQIENSFKDKELNSDNDYYQECCKLYIANVILTNQLKELIVEKNQMQEKLEKYEKKNEGSENEKSKRHRRTAQEISRNFVCPIESCNKQYGAEASLTQHLKLKHPNEYFNIISKENDNNSDNSQNKESVCKSFKQIQQNSFLDKKIKQFILEKK